MGPLRSMFFIDGFNVYHSLATGFRKYLWLDFYSLARNISSLPYEDVQAVNYFTAFATWKPASVSRHRDYVEVIKNSGVDIVLGRFQEKQRKCAATGGCGRIFTAHEEKLTDVNIALSIVETCVNNKCDILYLVSGDNDLTPALEVARKLCNGIKITVVLPLHAKAKNLKQICSRNGYSCISISEPLLSKSQFPNNVTIGGKIYSRPSSWS